jgi:hypothetical protein
MDCLARDVARELGVYDPCGASGGSKSAVCWHVIAVLVWFDDVVVGLSRSKICIADLVQGGTQVMHSTRRSGGQVRRDDRCRE